MVRCAGGHKKAPLWLDGLIDCSPNHALAERRAQADGSEKAPPTRVGGAKSREETSKGGKGSLRPVGTRASCRCKRTT
jgi:hypothetical protein